VLSTDFAINTMYADFLLVVSRNLASTVKGSLLRAKKTRSALSIVLNYSPFVTMFSNVNILSHPLHLLSLPVSRSSNDSGWNIYERANTIPEQFSLP
jgi:hypothetical protein